MGTLKKWKKDYQWALPVEWVDYASRRRLPELQSPDQSALPLTQDSGLSSLWLGVVLLALAFLISILLVRLSSFRARPRASSEIDLEAGNGPRRRRSSLSPLRVD